MARLTFLAPGPPFCKAITGNRARFQYEPGMEYSLTAFFASLSALTQKKVTLVYLIKPKNFNEKHINLVLDQIRGILKQAINRLLLSASPYSVSPQRDSNLHFTRSTSSPSLAPTLSMSSLTKSIHLLLGLPLFLLPGTAISIILFPT